MRICENGKYRDMTKKEVQEFEASLQVGVDAEINILKQNLADTDYVIIKIAEGVATPEEYASIIAQRQEWRNQINLLQEGDEQ